jgi:hypothetical protein
MSRLSGGGYTSNKLVETNNPKREPINHAVSPGAVSRLGGLVGEGAKFKSLYQNYNPQKTSNPIGPTDGMAQGPGANRTVMRSGSQAPCNPPRSMGTSRKF